MQRHSRADKVFHNLGHVHQPLSCHPQSCPITGTARLSFATGPSPHLDTLTLPAHPSGLSSMSLPPGQAFTDPQTKPGFPLRTLIMLWYSPISQHTYLNLQMQEKKMIIKKPGKYMGTSIQILPE